MSENYRKIENIILSSYIFWMINSVLNITMWDRIGIVADLLKYLKEISYLFLIFAFVTKKYTRKDVVGIFIIIFVGVVSSHSVYNKYVIPTMLFVYFSGDVDYRKILKSTFAIQSIIMLITIFASQMGIIEDIIWYEGSRVRHSLGYDYCGYPAHLILFITLIWFCIRQKARIVDAAVFLFFNYIIYVLTDSRTDFYLSLIGIFGYFVWDRASKNSLVICFRNMMIKHGFIIAAVASVSAQMNYKQDNSIFSKLNSLLNNRLQFGYDAIQVYGFTLFGQKIHWVGQGGIRKDPTQIYNYVDCSFLKEGLTFGLIFLVLLAFGFYLTGKLLVKNKRYKLSWAILISLAYSVINAHLLVLTFNVFILALGTVFQCTDEAKHEISKY